MRAAEDAALGRRGARGPGSQALSPGLELAPDAFALRVLLEETRETFRVASCRGDMTVRELKEELDLVAGIPFHLQRLQYLDQGILMDDSTLKFQDVGPGGIISLSVWHYDGWTELVLAATEGDPSKLSCLGVTKDSFYQTANSQRLDAKQRRKWISQRAFVALYIASHRGQVEAVQYLLEHGANCLGRSPVGRTPLHVAAAMGRSDCVTLLLKFGASISSKDSKGMTPTALAQRMNHKLLERRLLLCQQVAKAKLGGKSPGGPNPANPPLPRLRSGSGSKKSKPELPRGRGLAQAAVGNV